jgi:hypothetical protein
MRAQIAMAIAFLLVVLPTVSADQNTPNVWYFATVGGKPASTQLIAYNPYGKGTINTLIMSGVDNSGNVPLISGWRLEDNLALVWMTVNGERGLYKLTSTEARLLATEKDLAKPFDPTIYPTPIAYFIDDYRYPFVVSSVNPFARPDTSAPLAYPAMLVNLRANTVETLPSLVSGVVYCCRFSRDGSTLYYVGLESPESKTSIIKARILNTDQEHSVGKIPTDFPEPDLYGEHWLYDVAVSGVYTYFLLNPDGTTKTVGTQVDQLTKKLNLWSVFGNELLGYDPDCEKNCVLQLREIDTAQSQRYVLTAPLNHTAATPLYKTQQGDLVLYVSDYGKNPRYWLLRRDGSAVLIGFRNDQYYFDNGARSRQDTNGRWILAFDDPTSANFRVWDLVNRTYVLTVHPENPPPSLEVWLGKDAFLINDYGSWQALLYRDGAGKTIDLPHTDVGTYVDLLPDATLLYRKISSSGLSEIYHYDPDTDHMTLIVRKGSPIDLDTLHYVGPE